MSKDCLCNGTPARLAALRENRKRDGTIYEPEQHLRSQAFWGGCVWKAGNYHARWAEEPEEHLRFVGTSDKVGNVDHKGWYTDSWYDDTVYGVVFRLSSNRGFVYGSKSSTGDNGVAFVTNQNGQLEVLTSETDAAYYADRFAEAVAYMERESEVEEMAETDIETARGEIADLRSELRYIIVELKESNLPKALCGAVTSTIYRVRQKSHEAFKLIKTRQNNPWSSVGG